MNSFLCLSFCATLLSSISAECGYSACHKTDPKKLNIHLIAHSHDDVGWMVTPDYYYDVETRTIITNVVRSLEANAARRYTQVEMYFFHRWWMEQTQQTRDAVKKLVDNGQLVFSNGGWTVNDEGAAHYNNIIDQMTLGLKFLNETFGKCGHPKVSWQIDPFGASKEMPSLYAQMGFDGHVYNRGPLPKGEYIWKASNDLNTKIFTTILHSHYSAPNGFNFEDGKNGLNTENSAHKADEFVGIARNWNKDYGSINNVLMTMGDDFQYQKAENWFSNMDKLIVAVKARHPDVDIFYSTPNCYINAVNSLNHTFSERDVDYLTYWVGYYTNRPSLKLQDRITNNMLQASKQLDVLSRLDPTKSTPHLNEARNQVAIMTHHDAITGTSPQHTSDDYTERLQSSYSASKVVVQKALFYLKNKGKTSSTEMFCDSLNITECSLTETNNKIAVTLYNPIGRPVSQYIRVPVVSADYEVYDSSEQKVTQKAILPISESVLHLPERQSKATDELVFKVQLPALGFATYFIDKISKTGAESRHKRAPTEMKGKSFTLTIDDTTGALTSITFNGKTHKLRQSFKYYKSIGGQKGFEDSGSYHFCPDGVAQDFGQQKLISRHSSGTVHELNQQFSDYVKQTVRTYEDEDYIEFDWTVGPIPLADKIGKEIITRFETDFKTQNIFFTDANGRQTIKRHFDANRKGCVNNVIAGNWYPIYSRIAIEDQGLQMTVLTDRTQGGSSLTEGEVELMVHRRLTHKGAGGDFMIDEPGTDGKGLIARGKHYLFFNTKANTPQLVRPMAESLFMSPIALFDKYSTIKEFSAEKVVSFSALSHPLPESVHLLTLENWRPNQVLIRLEHMYESADNSPLSKPVEVNLENLFKTFQILDMKETNLVANELLSETKRLHWNSQSLTTEGDRRKRAVDFKVNLTPQQIRTFILTLQDNIHKEEKCTVSWVSATQKSIPANAYIAGHDIHGEPFNICRHKISTDMIAGKADKQLGCVVTYGGKENYITTENFEVMVAKNVEWVARHGTDPLPEHALVAGTKPGGNTYVGRCLKNGSLVVGKIDYDFYYGFSGREWKDCNNHEVLVCV